MTFEITENKTLKLANVNGRKEHHGDQLVQAVDLAVHGNFPNFVLRQFDQWLLNAIFGESAPESDDQQRPMDLAVHELSKIRFAKLKYPLKWNLVIEGATLNIFYGRGAPIVVSMCRVKDFEITPLDGGTVEIAFKISSNADITEKVLGKLGYMSGTDIEVTLLPPAVDAPDPRQSTIGDAPGDEQPGTSAPNGKPGWPYDEADEPAPDTPEAALAAAAGLPS